MTEAFERARKFLTSLDKCSLLYHKDADGVCSAVLVSKFLGDKIKMVSPNDSLGIRISDSLLKEINKIPYAVFVDLAVDQWDMNILPKTLVIDHHIPKKDLNKEGFVHVNPRLEDQKIYKPASYLVYKILEGIDKNIKKYAWIAAVGIIGDKGSIEGLSVNAKREDLKFLSDIIEACKGVHGANGIIDAYNIFLNAEKPDDILNSKLINTYHKFQKELDKTVLDFRYHSEYFEKTNSYLYRVESKYNVTSAASTIISEKYPDAAVFLYKLNKKQNLSARCQTGRINVAELLEKISKGLGSGGGHPQAAAATIPKEHSEKFLERLRNELEGI